MSDILYVIGGWFGLLLRPALLLQVLVVLALVFVSRVWLLRHRRHQRGAWGLLPRLAALVALLLAQYLFGLLGLTAGLLGLAAQLFVVSLLLEALRLSLRRWCAAAAVERFWRQAVRPLFAVLTVLLLIDRLDGLARISELELFSLFGDRISVGDVMTLIWLPYFLIVLSVLPVVMMGWIGERLLGMTAANRKAFELILRYILIGMGALWIASRIGLNGTAVTAIAGGLSVGLGFGIKEVISNFVSGIWLLFEGSVRPGDILLYEGDPCEVRRLSLRAATLWRDTDNTELVIPNQIFFTSATTTFTGTDHLRRSSVNVGTAYRHDPEMVIPLLEEIAGANPRVLAQPAPKAFLVDYGDSAILYSLRYYIADPMTNLGIASEVRRAIWQEFLARGIEIPYPQRVVHPPPSC